MKAISRFSKSLALAAPVVAMSAEQAEAAAYIKFDGIDGEATSENFKGYVKLDFFKIEIEGANAQSGARFTDFKVNLAMEKASPALMLACATGQVLDTAEVVITTGEGGEEVPYLQYKLTNVLVSSYSVSGSGQSEALPTEQVSFNFTKISWTYISRDEDGKETDRFQSPDVPKEGPR